MHVRATLNAWENSFINFLCELLALTSENNPTTRSAERLVRSRGDDVEAIVKRIAECLAGDEACDVRHICHRNRAHFLCNVHKLFVVERARVCRKPRNDEFRFVFERDLAETFVVYLPCLWVFHFVRDEFVNLRRKRHRMTMREVPAVGEIHAEHGVPWLKKPCVDGEVGWRARVWLDVGEFAVEERADALDGEALDDVREFLPAVIAAARIAFGVFVGENGAVGSEHVLRNIVLARDELKPLLLPSCLARYCVKYLRFFV